MKRIGFLLPLALGLILGASCAADEDLGPDENKFDDDNIVTVNVLDKSGGSWSQRLVKREIKTLTDPASVTGAVAEIIDGNIGPWEGDHIFINLYNRFDA